MQAIILAGGLGTRLRSILPDLPKPMAPVNNKPFLAYLLDYLNEQGVKCVIFSVHYLKDAIYGYFQKTYKNITIDYVVEPELLGTGGAINHVLSSLRFDKPVFVLNGDTLIKLDYQAMYQRHCMHQSLLTIALRSVKDCERYGQVLVKKNTIIEFREKGEHGNGLINAGVYVINPDLFSSFNLLPTQFSFEKDFLLKYLSLLQPQAFVTNDYFIDIGVPEDYARAQIEM